LRAEVGTAEGGGSGGGGFFSREGGGTLEGRSEDAGTAEEAVPAGFATAQDDCDLRRERLVGRFYGGEEEEREGEGKRTIAILGQARHRRTVESMCLVKPPDLLHR
jgi:hypothetical protein